MEDFERAAPKNASTPYSQQTILKNQEDIVACAPREHRDEQTYAKSVLSHDISMFNTTINSASSIPIEDGLSTGNVQPANQPDAVNNYD